jgi:hypothetical protein
MNRWLIYSLLAIALGAALFVFGEYDDSPGGQLLGLAAMVLGVAGLVRSREK